MRLRDLLVLQWHRFYKQTWYMDEPFLDVEVDTAAVMPLGVRAADRPTDAVLSTATLAWLYVHNSPHAIWTRYLWTTDRDHMGQAVYVGDNGHGLEIHRHLHLTDRWGMPTW